MGPLRSALVIYASFSIECRWCRKSRSSHGSWFGFDRLAAGALFIVAGVLANMHIYFQPTSLFNTIVMLVLLVGGLGLIARAMRPHSTS